MIPYRVQRIIHSGNASKSRRRLTDELCVVPLPIVMDSAPSARIMLLSSPELPAIYPGNSAAGEGGR